ncbi:MAG: hypothetical protein ACYCZU_06695 [Devosia sp.]
MRYVIIGRTGDRTLLVVDTQLRTVEVLDASSGAPAAIQAMRAEGGAIYKHVDVAIASDRRDDGAARWFYADD